MNLSAPCSTFTEPRGVNGFLKTLELETLDDLSAHVFK